MSTHAMVIEASVTGRNEGFTDNGLQIWYYETPEVINLNINGAPINQQKHVLIKTDFKWATNDVSKIKQYGNFTCRFSSKDGKRVAYTKARMETYPIGSLDESLKPTHVRCQNPLWNQPEEAVLDISINGADYLGGFAFTFFENIDLFRIAPMAGPLEGNTRVKLFGSGFGNAQNKEDVFVKFGITETDKINKD